MFYLFSRFWSPSLQVEPVRAVHFMYPASSLLYVSYLYSTYSLWPAREVLAGLNTVYWWRCICKLNCVVLLCVWQLWCEHVVNCLDTKLEGYTTSLILVRDWQQVSLCWALAHLKRLDSDLARVLGWLGEMHIEWMHWPLLSSALRTQMSQWHSSRNYTRTSARTTQLKTTGRRHNRTI